MCCKASAAHQYALYGKVRGNQQVKGWMYCEILS